MNKEDLKIGQWYLPDNYRSYPFMVLELTDNGIQANYINQGDGFRENQQISNSDFWKYCKEINGCPKEYQRFLPEEYRQAPEYQLFN